MAVTEATARSGNVQRKSRATVMKKNQRANRQRNRANNRNRDVEALTITTVNMSSSLQSTGLRQRGSHEEEGLAYRHLDRAGCRHYGRNHLSSRIRADCRISPLMTGSALAQRD